MSTPSSNPVPWYAPESKRRKGAASRSPQGTRGTPFPLLPWLLASFLVMALSAPLGVFFQRGIDSQNGVLDVLGLVVCLCLGACATLVQVWVLFNFLSSGPDVSLWGLASDLFRGHSLREEPRSGMPAPEAALHQFVQQVRAYAAEKSFQRAKSGAQLPTLAQGQVQGDPGALLRRRWNEVLDTLNEFEIYLAGDPQAMIEKLVARQPMHIIDVSQVFRDVAESFDTTWRRKGINIEAAIVTPLKATTNEALLRRLLVGPWRACVFLARRGNSVLFSAKSQSGTISARWEVEGLSIPEEVLTMVGNQSLTVNARIEQGMLALDPQNPSTLHALISLVTWIDLVRCSETDFRFGHTNDGFVIEMKLK